MFVWICAWFLVFVTIVGLGTSLYLFGSSIKSKDDLLDCLKIIGFILLIFAVAIAVHITKNFQFHNLFHFP